jgi:hypothetical protein
VRRFLTLALTVFALAGCRDTLAPEEVVGTLWILVSIDGQRLPYLEAQTSHLSIEILEGWLRFDRDATYALGFYRRAAKADSVEFRTDEERGIYFIVGSYVHLHWTTGMHFPESWKRASVEGDTLWLEGMENEQPTGSTSVYLRRYEVP